jgi:cyclase
MEMKQVSDHCFAVLNEKNRVCDANSGLINLGGGVVIDTQSDLRHAQEMIDLFSRVWPGMPNRVINTHEDGDHVWGNQLFEGAEIIAHSSVPERMKIVADPEETRHLMASVQNPATCEAMRAVHPGLVAAGKQLAEDYDLTGVELVFPTTVFDKQHELNLNGTHVHLTHVGPCHQCGDTIIHVPDERVVFAGDVLFRRCTPMGWTGTYADWIRCLDLLIDLAPEAIVPGHGPVCGVEGVVEMKSYLEYVLAESRRCFEKELSAMEAAKLIDFGPYGDWKAPARLYMNIERAYREFRGEPPDAPWNSPATFDAIYEVATAKGVPVEY